MRNKTAFTVRLDEELYRKLLAVAAGEGMTLNNHLLKLIRTNVAYYERVHGRIDPTKVTLPAESEE